MPLTPTPRQDDPFDDLVAAIAAAKRERQREQVRDGDGGRFGRHLSAAEMLAQGKVWRTDVPPPLPFAQFVRQELDFVLYPEQERAITEALPDDPALLFFPRPEEQEYWDDWPNGPPVRNPAFPLKALISDICYCWGKGSGKDLICSLLVSYFIYTLLHFDDPAGFFQHSETEPYDIINCAINAKQAQNVFFNKLKNQLRRPVFGRLIPDKSDFVINADHVLIYRRLEGFSEPIEFIRCWSMHSKSDSVEGNNVIAFILDEASGFELRGKKEMAEDDAGEEYALSPADALFGVLQSSAATRFEGQYLGFVISYPRHEDDFTMRMYRQADPDRAENYYREDELADPSDPTERRKIGKLKSPHVFGHKAPTWEINLRKPRASFEKYFRQNPEKANMMYACIPPPAKGGYFSVPQKIDEAFDVRLRPTILWRPTLVARGGREYIGAELLGHRFSPENLYTAYCDPGLSNDAFTLAIAHPNYARVAMLVDEKGREYPMAEIVVDALLVWRPDVRAGRVVDLIGAGQTIVDLTALAAGAMRHWGADRWNTGQLEQQLAAAHVATTIAGDSNRSQVAMYENLKALLYSDLLRFPGRFAGPVVDKAPWEHDPTRAWGRLRDELRRVQLINGTKIDHASGGSKDCADAVVGAVWLASRKSLGQRAFEGFSTAAAPTPPLATTPLAAALSAAQDAQGGAIPTELRALLPRIAFPR